MSGRPVIHPDARSSYRRYGKTPYRYSDVLGKLADARKRADHDEGDRLARMHSEGHGLRWAKVEPGPVDW